MDLMIYTDDALEIIKLGEMDQKQTLDYFKEHAKNDVAPLVEGYKKLTGGKLTDEGLTNMVLVHDEPSKNGKKLILPGEKEKKLILPGEEDNDLIRPNEEKKLIL